MLDVRGEGKGRRLRGLETPAAACGGQSCGGIEKQPPPLHSVSGDLPGDLRGDAGYESGRQVLTANPCLAIIVARSGG